MVNVIINVKDKAPLFDVSVSILPSYKSVVSGKSVASVLRLINAGTPENPIDVKVKLTMTNFNKDKIYESGEETIGISNELSIIRELTVPAETPPGVYVLIASATYNNGTIVESYDTFEVVESKIVWFVPGAEQKVLLAVLILIAALFYIRSRYMKNTAIIQKTGK